MEEVLRDGAAASYQLLASGVIFARMSGLITVQVLTHMHVGRQRKAPGFPGASVCDFRSAVLAFSAADLDSWLLDQGVALRSVPSAVIVTPPQVELFLEHAASVAASGINRQVFLAAAPAMRWAEAHAARRRST